MALPATALQTLSNVTDPTTRDSPSVGTSCFSCGHRAIPSVATLTCKLSAVVPQPVSKSTTWDLAYRLSLGAFSLSRIPLFS